MRVNFILWNSKMLLVLGVILLVLSGVLSFNPPIIVGKLDAFQFSNMEVPDPLEIPINHQTGVNYLPKRKGNFKLDRREFNPAVIKTAEELLPLVQKFIRSVKGLANDPDEEEYPLVSGLPKNYVPGWTYHPYAIKVLAQVELKIFSLLKKFLEKKKMREFVSIYNYLDDIETSSMRAFYLAPSDPYVYIASHPILTYRLIRRYAEDLQPVLSQLMWVDADFIQRISNETNPKKYVFPRAGDLKHALEGLSRIQLGNVLETTHLATGVLQNVPTGINLTALHALEIGTYYYDQGILDLAIEWMHVSLVTMENAMSGQADILKFMRTIMTIAVTKHNVWYKSMSNNPAQPHCFTKPVSLPFVPGVNKRRFFELAKYADHHRNLTYFNWALKTNFQRVCGGENLQSEEQKVGLKCWHERTWNKYWEINPLKVELLHKDPPVYQIYDIVGNAVMEKIKATASDDLTRSQSMNEKTGAGIMDSTRTSTQVWMDHHSKEHGFLEPLSKKLQIMSGLNLWNNASGWYQVACYGPSQHYDVHFDWFTNPKNKKNFADDRFLNKGNRIATIMIYGSEVQSGGRTAFPVLGFYAEPVKGSILMWNVMKRNGLEGDLRTWHGGCPVTLGIKWVFTQWAYSNFNMDTFKCTLRSGE